MNVYCIVQSAEWTPKLNSAMGSGVQQTGVLADTVGKWGKVGKSR